MVKKHLIKLVCLCAIAVILGIGFYAVYCGYRNMQRAEMIYLEANSVLSGYPELPDSYEFAEYYLRNGTDEYLILMNGQNSISATRNQEGETVYYIDGNAWSVEISGDLEKHTPSQNPAPPALSEIIETLLSEQDVTYACDKNAGRDLLVGVDVNDWYISCNRAGYDEWDEYMACGENDERAYVVWHAISDSETQLYAYLESSGSNHSALGDGYVTYWGTLPNVIIGELFQ